VDQRRLLVRTGFAILLVTMPGTILSMGPVPLAPEDMHSIEKQILHRVNGERSAKRIPQLNWNDQVAAEARRHAANIATGGFFAHEDPVRGNIDRRLDESGVSWHRCAENIYAGDADGLIDEAVSAWRLSPPHYRAMMDSMFSEAGVGVAVKQNGTVIVVQEFILK